MFPLPVPSRAIDRMRPRLPEVVGGLASAALAVAMLGLPVPLDILLVPGVALGVLVLLVPAAAPIFLVASVPIQDLGAVALGGQVLTATKVAVATTAVVVPLALFGKQRLVRIPMLAVALLLYILAQVISLRSAPELLPGFAEIYRWAVMLLAFLAVLHLVRSPAAVIALGLLVATAAVAEAALGMAQAFFGLAPESYAVAGGLFRAYGTFGKPNPYAGYLELTGLWLLPLALWAVREWASSTSRWQLARRAGFRASGAARRQLLGMTAMTAWIGAGTAASFAGIALSFSRGAWLGALAALTVLLLAASRRVQAITVGVAVMGTFVLLVGGVPVLPEAVRERAVQLTSQIRLFDVRDVPLTDETFAAIERMTHWQAGLAMAQVHPWTGVGVGNFNVRFAEFSPHPRFRISQGHAHNYYIHAAAETGLLGLSTYLLVLSLALAVAIRATRDGRTPLDRALGRGALAATTALAVHNVVENLHVLNLSIQLAAVWALAVVAHRDGIDFPADTQRPVLPSERQQV
jgi:O-antigen ligase